MSHRYKITTEHGEGATVWHVVDTQAHDADQPAILASYSTAKLQGQAHRAAIACRDVHNAQSCLCAERISHLDRQIAANRKAVPHE
jgi:hypothetical protein